MSELTPEEQATVDRFGMFEPEEILDGPAKSQWRHRLGRHVVLVVGRNTSSGGVLWASLSGREGGTIPRDVFLAEYEPVSGCSCDFPLIGHALGCQTRQVPDAIARLKGVLPRLTYFQENQIVADIETLIAAFGQRGES